jgi:hypothetical protein
MGYTATGYDGNVGNIIMQPFGGNVGIGATSPSTRLTVEPSSGTANAITWRKSGVTSAGALAAYSDGNGPVSTFGNNFSLNAAGSVGRFDASYSGWSMSFDNRTTVDAITFAYISSAGAYSERVRITSDGNVGVGTTNVSLYGGYPQRLYVKGTMTGGYFGLVTFENDTNSGDSNHGILHLYNSKTTAIGDDARIMFSFKEGDGSVHPLASMGAVKEGSYQGAIQFNTRSAAGSYSEKMRITNTGNVGIGTTAPVSKLDVVYAGNTAGGTMILSGSKTNNSVKYGYLAGAQYASDAEPEGVGIIGLTATSTDNFISIGGGVDEMNTSTGIRFYTASSATERGSLNERARITSGGYFKASNNGSYSGGATSSAHTFDQSIDNNALLVYATNTALSTPGIFWIEATRNTANNTFYAISYYNSGAAAHKFRVADSGNVTNTNGSYGTISDAKMKTDIVDAGSQWSDIKALRFRKFKMKDDPQQIVQLGVVAQEVEQVSPGLVEEHTDRDAEGNNLGTTTKSVKTSVLLMKAAAALQEAMARIEALEAEVAALKNA